MDQELVIKWDSDKRELYGDSLFDKAIRFVDHGCIHYISDKHFFIGEGRAFIVLPLNTADVIVHEGVEFFKTPYSYDYNRTVYVITISYDKNAYKAFGCGNFFHCNCQGWKSKDVVGGDLFGVNCCHVLALKAYFKRQSIEKTVMEV